MQLGDFELQPDVFSPEKFGSGINSLQFFSENGKLAGFRLSRGRIKNVLFIKRG